MKAWPFVENIFLLILIGFLCWLWDSGWPILLILASNQVTIRKNK